MSRHNEPLSDKDGHNPTLSESDSQSQTDSETGNKSPNVSETVEEDTVKFFPTEPYMFNLETAREYYREAEEEHGLQNFTPSSRTFSRWCERGILKAKQDPRNRRQYWIDKKSLEDKCKADLKDALNKKRHYKFQNVQDTPGQSFSNENSIEPGPSGTSLKTRDLEIVQMENVIRDLNTLNDYKSGVIRDLRKETTTLVEFVGKMKAGVILLLSPEDRKRFEKMMANTEGLKVRAPETVNQLTTDFEILNSKAGSVDQNDEDSSSNNVSNV